MKMVKRCVRIPSFESFLLMSNLQPTKRFVCPSCQVSCARKSDLRRHERIHLLTKPFACPTCARPFTRRDSLKRHTPVCKKKKKLVSC